MKVVIQDTNTKDFYKSAGQWTEQRNEARTFSSAAEAAEKCRKEKLRAQIILTFPDPAYDMVLPCW